MWATTHRFDPIQLPGLVNWYGTDPVKPEFGAHIFAREWIPNDPKDEHSAYATGTSTRTLFGEALPRLLPECTAQSKIDLNSKARDGHTTDPGMTLPRCASDDLAQTGRVSTQGRPWR